LSESASLVSEEAEEDTEAAAAEDTVVDPAVDMEVHLAVADMAVEDLVVAEKEVVVEDTIEESDRRSQTEFPSLMHGITSLSRIVPQNTIPSEKSDQQKKIQCFPLSKGLSRTNKQIN